MKTDSRQNSKFNFRVVEEQFLTVYSGTVNEYNKLLPFRFKGTTASDLRIVLGSDRVGISEVKLEQLKKK